MDARQPNGGRKQVILFLHGFMGNGADWQPVIENLPDSYCSLAPDLPGHGSNLKNNWPEGFIFSAWKEELVSVLRRHHIASCHVVGYSMGGRLALYLALHQPEIVSSLILESASPGIDNTLERTTRFDHDRKLANEFVSRPWHESLVHWYDQPVFSGIKSHPLYQELLERRLNNSPQQLAHVLRGTSPGLQPSLWQRLSELKMPVLALAGERDIKYCHVIQTMLKFNNKIKNYVVPGTGHNIHFENPGTFAAEILKFLSMAEEN